MIELKCLKKTYNQQEALKGISIAIDKGEFYGLLGPNGAGNTTTISIMSSILQPDSGEVMINGHNIYAHQNQTKQIIGVVPQEIALYNELSAYENLVFWGGMNLVPKKHLKQRITDVLNLLQLYDRRNDKVNNYSGGMKRRINIAAALLHQPSILFMDEPTVGIDPQSRNLIFEVIENLHQSGMTIVYTTHYMEEAERLCDRIGIIDNGKIIAEGTLAELKTNSKIKEAILITFHNLTENAIHELSSFWKDLSQLEGQIFFYTTDLKSDLSKVILKCQQIGLDISNIEIQKANLESIFLSLTGKQLRD